MWRFVKGIAQNAVQLESALSNRKRKASEMERDAFTGKLLELSQMYFLKCSYNEAFKLSELVTVVYKTIIF
jgi:hypothetical protein